MTDHHKLQSTSRVPRSGEIISVCDLYEYRIVTASVAEWLRAWDTLTMFEATVCGRS